MFFQQILFSADEQKIKGEEHTHPHHLLSPPLHTLYTFQPSTDGAGDREESVGEECSPVDTVGVYLRGQKTL